jgi:hypothetical protein
MSPFRRVTDGRAGANALGILVPTVSRTVVIVRPRALPWDLLLVQTSGATLTIRQLGRDEAATAARQLFHALEAWACGGSGTIKIAPSADGDGYWVRIEVGEFCLLTCRREPGKPYRPTVFPTPGEAESAGSSVAAVLCPLPEAEQEYYFNTQNFQSERPLS